MNKKLLFLAICFTSLLVVSAQSASAQSPAQNKLPQAAPTPPLDKAPADPEAKPTEEPLQILKPAVVASYGRFTMRGKALDQELDNSVPGDTENSPVVGSVKKFGSTRCMAVMTNNSEKKTFSVTFELSQSTKETLDRPKKKLFTATLGPKRTVEREFKCDPIDIMQLNLKSGRELRSS